MFLNTLSQKNGRFYISKNAITVILAIKIPKASKMSDINDILIFWQNLSGFFGFWTLEA